MGEILTKLMGTEPDGSRDYIVYVRTGDKRGAGTDSNVSITLCDKEGQSSGPHKLDRRFKNAFERNKIDQFRLKKISGLDDISEIVVLFDAKCVDSDWFLDRIVIEDKFRNEINYFPCHRWLRQPKKLTIAQYDSCLPQYSPHPEQRKEELAEKRRIYEYAEKTPGLQLQLKNLPEEDNFSDRFLLDLEKRKYTLIAERNWAAITAGEKYFKSLKELKELYRKLPSLPEPQDIGAWKSDTSFGDQRLSSCNPKLIRLCKKIPDNFDVNPTSVEPLLETLSLQDALKAQRIFIVDLKILEGTWTVSDSVLCAPLALFFLTGEKTLIPLAIQLFQEKRSDNPVFYPSDDPYVWLIAKMWYNNADASYHQSIVHFGFTHLVMEGICVATQRHLSPSHPVYKLLAPHFLNLLAINTRALRLLLDPGGWIDKTMSIGSKGIMELIVKSCGLYMMSGNGDFVQDLHERGVYDEAVLPDYDYRDDALQIYNAISSYVTKMVKLFYEKTEDIVNDEEVQNWGHELVAPRGEGLGLKGVYANGSFTTHDELVAILRNIIFTCSVEHGAANFGQYDAYAFPPNYPGFMRGTPPQTKEPLTEENVMKHLGSKAQILDVMVITKILSTRSTKALGDFEVMYIYEPNALKIIHEFQDDLKQISQKMKASDQTRRVMYTILDPTTIPNSISI